MYSLRHVAKPQLSIVIFAQFSELLAAVLYIYNKKPNLNGMLCWIRNDSLRNSVRCYTNNFSHQSIYR